jgi:GT2 family glycosyltransferase
MMLNAFQKLLAILRTQRFWIMAGIAMRTSPRAALSAILCILGGKRVRGWHRLVAVAARNPIEYSIWIRLTEPLAFSQYLDCHADKPARPPNTGMVACLILPAPGRGLTDADRTADSLKSALGDQVHIWSSFQDMPEATCHKHVASASLAETLDKIRREGPFVWLIPLVAGDVVSHHLHDCLMVASRNWKNAEAIYWDEDELSEEGTRKRPWIKPDWDEHLFLARDMLCGSAAFAMKALISHAQCSEPTGDITEQLTKSVTTMAAAAKGNIGHIPLVLTHRSTTEGFMPPVTRANWIAQHWPEKIKAETRLTAAPFLSIRFPAPPKWPSVSILIPTRDNADLLAACLSGLQRLDYGGEINIIVIDNGSTQKSAIDLISGHEQAGFIRVIRDAAPFNFSRLNNLAAQHANGEFLCLMNNDIEPLDGAWLSEMMRHAVRSRIGAVGAMLLYPDRTIQHAGVTIGMGNAAGHIERGIQPDDLHHYAWHAVTRQVSAVTAACLLLRKEYYFSVGGLDENVFEVAFNDVDLCLKLDKAGLRNIYVAEAQLLHHESKSRGSDYSPENIERFRRELVALQERWGTTVHQDPYFSRRFARASEQCQLEI